MTQSPGSDDETVREAERRKRRALVFGDVLPDATTDERGDGGEGFGPADADADEWLRRQVPPHHG